MTTRSSSHQDTQWHDYTDSEVDFTLPSYNHQYTTAQPLADGHHWQAAALGHDSANPFAYVTTPKAFDSPIRADQANAHSRTSMNLTMGSDPTSSHQFSPSDGSLSSASPQVQRDTGVCPLLSGQTKECVPQYCGIDAPCLSSVNQFPEIEESDQAPCVQRYYFMEPEEDQDVQMPEADIFALPVAEDGKFSSSPAGAARNTSSSTINKSATKSEDTARPKGRTAHSLVERKYRENLNAKIEELREALQKTRPASLGDRNKAKSSQTYPSNARVRKGDILEEALSYIYQSQVDMRHMAEEITRLKAPKPTMDTSRNQCDDCSLRKQIVNIRLLAEDME